MRVGQVLPRREHPAALVQEVADRQDLLVGQQRGRARPLRRIAGDQVVAVMRLSGRTEELEIDEVRSSLLTLRDGKIVRIEPFPTKDDALEATGRRE